MLGGRVLSTVNALSIKCRKTKTKELHLPVRKISHGVNEKSKQRQAHCMNYRQIWYLEQVAIAFSAEPG